jgi:hypothetical protein
MYRNVNSFCYNPTMIKRIIFLTLFCILFINNVSFSQSITGEDEGGSKTECEPYTPAPGTTERKAILDALREEVYRIFHLKVIFIVPYLKVFNGYAWVHTRPQSPDGSNHYEDVLGLIHKQNGNWKVLEMFSPQGDGPGCCADEQYFKGLMKKFSEAPPCIFPLH